MIDGAGEVMGVRWRSVVLEGEWLPYGYSTRQLVDCVPENCASSASLSWSDQVLEKYVCNPWRMSRRQRRCEASEYQPYLNDRAQSFGRGRGRGDTGCDRP
jgi:hypothetical protein